MPAGTAPAADGLLMQSAALPLLLQHHSISKDTQILTKLLMVSRVTRQAIHAHCQGAASIRLQGLCASFSCEHLLQFAAWLKTHAELLRQLHIIYSNRGTMQEAQEARIQLGIVLAQVLQRQQLLQLQKLEVLLSAADDLLMPLLLHCSASATAGVRGLTSLQLHSVQKAVQAQPVAPIIAALTALQELYLCKYFTASDYAQMQRPLPTSLIRLSLEMLSENATNESQRLVQLGHLLLACVPCRLTSCLQAVNCHSACAHCL